MGLGLAPIIAGMFALPWGGRIRRRLGGHGLLACGLFLVLVAAGALLGCGGNAPATTPPPQPKNYTITVTATSGTVTDSTTLHLTVQ